MTLINPYPNFTLEQIKFLNDNMVFGTTNHGHSIDVEFFNLHLNNPYYPDDFSELDKETQRTVEDILCYVFFLGEVAKISEKIHKGHSALTDGEDFTPEKCNDDLDTIKAKMLGVMNRMTENDKRIWPNDIMEEIKIIEVKPGLYELLFMSLYGYIDGFARVNGKKIDSNVSIERYVDTERNIEATNKALTFISEKCQSHITEIGDISNITSHKSNLQI